MPHEALGQRETVKFNVLAEGRCAEFTELAGNCAARGIGRERKCQVWCGGWQALCRTRLVDRESVKFNELVEESVVPHGSWRRRKVSSLVRWRGGAVPHER